MTSPVPGLNITRYQADLEDSDRATAQTLAVMCEQINKAAQDPVLCAAARDAVRRFRGGPFFAGAGINPWSSPHAIAESAWWWVKHALRFVHHDGLIQVWFNEHDQLQLLISPDLLLRMQDPRGQKYLAFHRALLGAPGPANEDKALAAANDQGLDIASLKHDMASDEVRATIAEDLSLARAVGITGTPGYVIGNNVVLGAVGIMALKARIDSARGQRMN